MGNFFSLLSNISYRSIGFVVQSVRAPPCHGGSCGFESRQVRIKIIRQVHYLGTVIQYFLLKFSKINSHEKKERDFNLFSIFTIIELIVFY
jgi:hypothetical protein